MVTFKKIKFSGKEIKMKKIIIILTTALIFSCSKTNDKKISDDDWKIFTKTCNTINNKIENELFLVTNDVCVIGDKELETEDDAVMKIKYSEKILKSRELRQKQKMMLKKFNELNKFQKNKKLKHIDFLLTGREPLKMETLRKVYKELINKSEKNIKEALFYFDNPTWEELFNIFSNNYEQVFGKENIEFGEMLNKFQETVNKENAENRKKFCESRKVGIDLLDKQLNFLYNSSDKEISYFLCGN